MHLNLRNTITRLPYLRLYKMKCSPKDTMAVMDGVEDKGASGKLKVCSGICLGRGLTFFFFPGVGSETPGNCIVQRGSECICVLLR